MYVHVCMCVHTHMVYWTCIFWVLSSDWHSQNVSSVNFYDKNTTYDPIKPWFTCVQILSPLKLPGRDFFSFFGSSHTMLFIWPNLHPINPSKPNSSPSVLSANWICSWLLIKSRADLHKVSSFAYGRQPHHHMPPPVSESLAQSQKQGRKLTSKQGGRKGQMEEEKRSLPTKEKRDGRWGEGETNRGKQNLMQWDRGRKRGKHADTHTRTHKYMRNMIAHMHAYSHMASLSGTSISADFAIRFTNY